MNSSLLQLRSNPARWSTVPLAVLGVAILFGRTDYWIGIWPETGAAIQVAAYFLSAFTAGVSAWIAAQTRLRGLQELFASAAINPFRIETSRFLATLFWLLLPYVVTGLAALTATGRSWPPGFQMLWGYLLLGAIMIVLGTSWGWLVGRVFSPVLSALCSLLSWFILASILARQVEATVMSGPPWLEVDLGVVLVRLIASALLAVAVCSAVSRRFEGSHARLTTVVSVVVVMGIAAAHIAMPVLKHREPVEDPLCVRGKIEYCLWPEHEKYLSLIYAVDAQVASLPTAIDLPSRIVDYQMSGATKWVGDVQVLTQGPFSPEIDISEGSRWALARGVARAIESEVFAKCSPAATADPELRRDQLFAWLEQRLAGGGTPDYTTNAPQPLVRAWTIGHQIAARAEHEQIDWALSIISTTKARYCDAA